MSITEAGQGLYFRLFLKFKIQLKYILVFKADNNTDVFHKNVAYASKDLRRTGYGNDEIFNDHFFANSLPNVPATEFSKTHNIQ